MQIKNLILALLISVTILGCTNTSSSAELKECDAGIGEACRKVGQDFQEKGNSAQAKKFFERSCNLENTNGCVRFAEMLVKEGDTATAKAKLRYACDRGNTNACARFAELLK